MKNIKDYDLEDLKKELVEIGEKPFRAEQIFITDILKKGSETARQTAAQTLSEVKTAMRINYFEDKELIAMQSAKYQGRQ